MGINIDRFIGDVDSNFICSICNDVLEDPLQAPKCEHSFCKLCIMQWLNTNNSCPLDRKKLTVNNLKPVSRILRSLLLRLTLTCNNQIHGCPATVALEELETHLLECSFNPKRLVSCSSGCGVTISFGELANHNCAQSLRLEMKETLERIEKGNEDKISKILGLELELMLGQKLERVEKENKNKMSKMLGINANLVQKLEKVEKANEEKMSKILSIHANLVEKLERVKKETEDKMSKVHNINSNLVKRLERVEKETEHKLSKMHNINANLSNELERVKKANEDEMSKILGINANLVEKLERVEKGNEDKTSKMHNINAHLVKELERVKKVNEYEMSKILGINANLVEKLERVEKGNEDKMSKMHNINTNLVKTLERVEKETEDKMSKMHDINTNLVKRLERVEKETGDQRSKMHNINITKMSEILGINANLVEKLERVEKGNEDKMLMIKSKLELLEAEMAKFRLSKSNSLHVESATLKQRLVAHVMSCVIQENVKIKEECRKLKRAAAIRESNVDNFVRIHTQSFFQPITYARLINFVLIGLRIPINCFRSICFN